MTHATVVVRDMIATGALKAPKNPEEYLTLVFNQAYQIADFSTGHREVKIAEAKAAYADDSDE
jgi:hypothetical protein